MRTPRSAARRIASPTIARGLRAESRSRTARGRATARRRRGTRRPAARSRAGCWPPSVRVRILMRSLIDRLVAARIGADDNFYRDGAGAALRRDRLERYLDAAGRRADPARRRGAGLPRRAGLGPPVHLRAAADREPARPRRRRRSCTASSPSSGSTDERAALERRPDASGHRDVEPRADARGDRRRRGVRARARRGRRVIAVGRIAHEALGGAYVRHPSHGGARAFAERPALV